MAVASRLNDLLVIEPIQAGRINEPGGTEPAVAPIRARDRQVVRDQRVELRAPRPESPGAFDVGAMLVQEFAPCPPCPK